MGPWSRNGNFSTTLLTNSIPGWPRIVVQNKNRTSPWKRWSPHWENSRISSRRRRDLSTICKNHHIAFFVFMSPLPVTYFITKSRDYCDSRDLTILLNTIHSFLDKKRVSTSYSEQIVYLAN